MTFFKKFMEEKRISPEIMGWLQDDSEGQKALREALDGIAEHYFAHMRSLKQILTPFIRIKIRVTTTKKLLEELDAKNIDVSSIGRSLFTEKSFATTNKMGEFDLVKVSLKELGFKKDARADEFTTTKFCAEWSEKYLDGYVIELCEPGDGPELRLQYWDQPKGEVLLMAMCPITAGDGDPGMFHILRSDDGVRQLHLPWAWPQTYWGLSTVIVFRLRKL